MRKVKIPVCVETSAHPEDCFGIGTDLRLGDAADCHPSMGNGVSRRKAECLVNVRFRFCASTEKKLGGSDESMSGSQVAIQCQCLLAFSDALCHAFRKYLKEAQKHVS